MKKIIGLFAVLALVATTFGLTLEWEANDPAEQVTNYKVEMAVGTGAFQVVTNAGTGLKFSTNLAAGVYRFRLRAENFWGESAASGVFSTPGLASSPRASSLYVIVGSKTNIIVPLNP